MLVTMCKQAELPSEALEVLESQSAELVEHVVELDYDYWTAGIELSSLDLDCH